MSPLRATKPKPELRAVIELSSSCLPLIRIMVTIVQTQTVQLKHTEKFSEHLVKSFRFSWKMESEYFSAISTKLDLLKLCLPTNTVHFWNHLSFNHIPYSICYKKFPDLKYRYLIFPKSTFPQHAPSLQTEYCSMKLR